MRSDIGSTGMFALPFYYMLTSTGLTIFVAISATTTIIVGMNGLAKLQRDEKTAFGRRASEVSACGEAITSIKTVTLYTGSKIIIVTCLQK